MTASGRRRPAVWAGLPIRGVHRPENGAGSVGAGASWPAAGPGGSGGADLREVRGEQGQPTSQRVLVPDVQRPRLILGPVYVMNLGRTNAGINKAEDAGMMDALIGFGDALRRLLPTTVVSYLPFRGWICQETFCNGISVTFDLRQRAGRTNCRLITTVKIDKQGWCSMREARKHPSGGSI